MPIAVAGLVLRYSVFDDLVPLLTSIWQNLIMIRVFSFAQINASHKRIDIP